MDGASERGQRGQNPALSPGTSGAPIVFRRRSPSIKDLSPCTKEGSRDPARPPFGKCATLGRGSRQTNGRDARRASNARRLLPVHGGTLAFTRALRMAAHYSGLMLAARITSAHFSISSAINLPKSVGEPVSTVPPRSAIRLVWHRRTQEHARQDHRHTQQGDQCGSRRSQDERADR